MCNYQTILDKCSHCVMAGLFCKQKADISYEMTRQAVNRSNPSASSKHPGQISQFCPKNNRHFLLLNWQKSYSNTFKHLELKIGIGLVYWSIFQSFMLKDGLLIFGQKFEIRVLVLLALVKVHIPKVPTPLQSRDVGFLYIVTKLYH